jgi:hypothetical protein
MTYFNHPPPSREFIEDEIMFARMIEEYIYADIEKFIVWGKKIDELIMSDDPENSRLLYDGAAYGL